VSLRGGEWLTTVPIAHRGLHDSRLPENSLPAFEAAAEAGFGIELDIHLTADGELAVFHDDDTARMTGQVLTVTTATSADLAPLRLAGTDYGIPMLSDVLTTIAGKVPILIEVKTGSDPARICPTLLAELMGYSGEFAIQSFDPRIVHWLKKNAAHIPRGQLSGSFAGGSMSSGRRALLRTMALNSVTRPHFIGFQVEAMPSAAVTFWRRILRAPVLLWTIRTPEQLLTAQRFHANPIFESVNPA
jgi:glycerophosphoryl diester phosphodiesterase